MARNSVHAVSDEISKVPDQPQKHKAVPKLRISVRLDIFLLISILGPQDLLCVFSPQSLIVN